MVNGKRSLTAVFSDAFNLTTNGRVGSVGQQFHDFKAGVCIAETPLHLPHLRGSGLRNADTDGAFAAPLVDYDINARRIIMQIWGVENLRAKALCVDTGKYADPGCSNGFAHHRLRKSRCWREPHRHR
jgi:hypothetical protein